MILSDTPKIAGNYMTLTPQNYEPRSEDTLVDSR